MEIVPKDEVPSKAAGGRGNLHPVTAALIEAFFSESAVKLVEGVDFPVGEARKEASRIGARFTPDRPNGRRWKVTTRVVSADGEPAVIYAWIEERQD